MKFIQCSMCRRAAAWVIDKEVIIETFGVDHFPIHRLTNEDDAFAIGGRFPKPNPKRKVATTPLGGAARCRKS